MSACLHLRRLDSRVVPLGTTEIRAFLAVRNEIQRLPSALTHHRALGVSRFFVVDNGSTDGTLDYLNGEADVHLFETSASYEDAQNGIEWLEVLLRIYGQDRWCLLLDADEQLVYPECESVGLRDFCLALEERGLNCLATCFVDLYPEGPITATSLGALRSPIETHRFFDATGYHHFPSKASRIPRIFGGVRARLFWPEIDLSQYSRDSTGYVERAFDEAEYLAEHQDVAAEVKGGRLESGLQHFIHYGRAESRSVTLREVPEWPERLYLALHPDVERSVIDGTFASGLEHYLLHGQFEGRLFWPLGPPCISQVPLVRYRHDMAIGIGRHELSGSTWRRSDAVGGAILHFKLTAELFARATAIIANPVAISKADWARENLRYCEVLARRPELSAIGPESASYRDTAQLIELGIIARLSEL